MGRSLFGFLAVMLAFGLQLAEAGTLVVNNFSNRTDAAAGISTDTTYTHLIDINDVGTYANVNGVVFDNTLGSYGLTGAGTAHPDHANNTASGGLHDLLDGFVYDGKPAVLTISGLTPGIQYRLRIYVCGWQGTLVTFSFDDTAPATVVAGLDRGANSSDPSSFDYTYALGDGDTDLTVTISPDNGNDTMHLYGFSNEEDFVPLAVAVTSPMDQQQFLSGSSVAATVAVVGDEAPYHVTFYTNSAVAWSTNSASTNLFNIELGALADGPYTNYAEVTDNVTSNAVSVTNIFSVVATDANAPYPDPMTFAVAPWSLATNAIVMTASAAIDALSPPVEYYFENITNSDTSGWVSGTVWTNTGLTEETTYGYQVKARDAASNETAYSSVSEASPAEPSVTWDNDGNGNWSDISNWNSGAGPVADGEDTTASFTNITANRTVTLDTDRTIGNISAVDDTHDFTIADNALTLNVTSGSPTIDVISGRTLTISSALAGSNGFTKSGPGTLTLSGGYTLTGDVILNGGTVRIHAYATISALSGSGALHRTSQNGTFTIQDGSAFYGELRTFAGGNSSHTIQFQSMGDAVGAGNLQTGGGTGDSNQRTKFRLYGDVGSLTLNHRAVEILSRLPTPKNWSSRGTRLDNDNSAATNRWVINTDLVNETDRNHELALMGNNTGSNAFAGVIGDSTGIGGLGAFYSTQTGRLTLLKEENGKWIVSGTNTYTGGTVVSGGTLVADGARSLGSGNATVSAGTLELNVSGAMVGSTLRVSGGTLVIGAADAMTNAVGLYLPSEASANLVLDADQTVAELYLNDARQPNGSYTNSESWINGPGTLTVGPASAQPIYWDIDGNSGAGAGGANPSGVWDGATANWHNKAGIGGTPAVWPAGRTAAFAAGTNATGDYAVSVVGTRDISGLTVEEGNVTLSGGTALRMTTDSVISVAAGSTATVATAISEDASSRTVVKAGAGALVLSGANSYSGKTTLSEGTLAIGADMALSNSLVFAGTRGTVSGDFALNFGAGAVIDSEGRDASSSGSGGVVHEMSCGISGSPDVHLRQSWWRGNDARCKQNRFEPSGTNTQALGVIRFDYYNDSGAGTRVVLGGSSTNNTVETFSAPNHSYDDRVQKEGSGTWTITGDSDGQYYGIDVYVEEGTLIWNGAHRTSGAYSIQNGRFAGNHDYTTTYDARGTINVKSNGILSPGVDGVGTMTFGWVGTLNGDGKLHMQDGSIYEYDVGAATNDLIRLSGSSSRTQTLDLDNFTLRVLDAGGDPQGDPLPVFTYDSYVNVDTNGFPNTAANFDLVTGGIKSWGSGGLSLSNSVSEGVIYLVGLVKPPSGAVIIVR